MKVLDHVMKALSMRVYVAHPDLHCTKISLEHFFEGSALTIDPSEDKVFDEVRQVKDVLIREPRWVLNRN